MVVSAKGRYLDSKQKWLVAEQLGEGACGTVHALHYQSKSASSSTNTQFAVKLAIEPPPSTNKKRKKTLVEKNADLLNHEHILYRNVLNNLRGTMIPDIPMASYSSIKTPPQGFGSIDGFRFLIMERMQAPFSSIVSSICSSSTTEIDIGPIGQRLIRLMEAIHDTHYIFVDVKPDNFMLCASAVKKGKSNKKCSEIESFAERIRMIDFGLLESNKDVMNNKHRANQHPDGQLVGTPVYASLNVLNGHTVSRRDDIEACIYVLMEFILQITACSQGNRDLEDLLPWSKARSDEEIRKMKEDAVDDKGDIWDILAQNGNKVLSKNVKQVFEIVRSMEFKDKPDYEGLCKMVAKWSVLTDFKKKKSRSGSKKTSSTSTTSKRKARSSRESDDDVKVAAKEKSPAKRVHTDDLSEDSTFYEFDEDVPPTSSLSSRATRAAARSAAKEREDDEVVVVDSTPTKSTRVEKLKKELKEAKSAITSLEEKVLEKELDEARSRISDLQDQLSEKEDGVSIIDIEMESMDENDNENNSSAANSAEGMDWEVVSTTSNTSKNDSSKPTKKKQSLKLECIQGPHQGETVELSDVLVLGSNPSNKKGGHTFSLSKDDNACASHTKLVLNRSGSKKNPVLMVKVFDLKSKNGTMINSKALPSGASRQAFIKDRIQVGSSVFRVMKE